MSGDNFLERENIHRVKNFLAVLDAGNFFVRINFTLADTGKMFQRVKKIFSLVALSGGIDELSYKLSVVTKDRVSRLPTSATGAKFKFTPILRRIFAL